MYQKIDSNTMDWAERLSHKLQTTLGWTNFTLAKFLAKIATIAPIAQSFVKIKEDDTAYFIIFRLFLYSLLCYINYIIFTKEIINFDESKVINNLSKGLSNDNKLTQYHRRMFYFIWSFIVLAFDVLTFDLTYYPIMWFIIWMAYIFHACTPLPPSESKVEQWVNSLKTALPQPSGA